MTDKRPIVVVDVPAGIAADETAQMLNDVCKRGYELRAVTATSDGHSRAFLSICVQPEQRIHGRGRDADGKESEALTIIRAHMDDSVFRLIQRLKDAGIKRGKNWVGWKRQELREWKVTALCLGEGGNF
jgi:hypothetical protein